MMADDITLERFRKKGGRWAYQVGNDPYLSIRPDGHNSYSGTLSMQARREIGDPDYVNVYTSGDPPILAFEATDDPDGNAYKVQESGALSLSAIIKQGFGLQPTDRWRIEGEYDEDRELLIFDLSPVAETNDE